MAKAGLHPNYQLATITCACGAVHEIASTRGSFSVEICSACHPFYTGKQKLLDAAGRIDRFNKRYQLKPGATADSLKVVEKKADGAIVVEGEVKDLPRADWGIAAPAEKINVGPTFTAQVRLTVTLSLIHI